MAIEQKRIELWHCNRGIVVLKVSESNSDKFNLFTFKNMLKGGKKANDEHERLAHYDLVRS